jgi:hypothetical protein
MHRAVGDSRSPNHPHDRHTVIRQVPPRGAAVKISGRPLFWFVVVIVVLMAWKAPDDMSAALGGIGNVFVKIAEGVGAFIHALTG